MLTTLLFDVDGVLLIGDPWDKDLAATYGITREMTGVFFKTAFPACLVGQADLKEELAAYLLRWNWPRSVDDFLAYWFERYTLHEELLTIIRHFRQQGIACYLATQQERYRAAYLWETLGFARFFDGIFSSSKLGFLKTDPRFFEMVLHQLQGYSSSTILFWDDHAPNVITARNAGLRAEQYTHLAHFLDTMRLERDWPDLF